MGEKKKTAKPKPKPKNNQTNKTFAINYSMLPRLLGSNCPKEYRAPNLQIPSRQVQSPGTGKRISTKERGEPNGFSGGRKLGQSSSRPKREAQTEQAHKRESAKVGSKQVPKSSEGWLSGAVGPRKKCVLSKRTKQQAGTCRGSRLAYKQPYLRVVHLLQ